MHPDPAASLSDAGTDLQKLDSESPHLGRLKFGAFQMSSHQEKEGVGKDMQIEAELIGEKPVTAEPIGLELQLQLLDPVFDLPSEHIDVVIDPLGTEAQVGHHKPLIGSLVGVLGLGDHTAEALP